jgi:hypothetical protein
MKADMWAEYWKWKITIKQGWGPGVQQNRKRLAPGPVVTGKFYIQRLGVALVEQSLSRRSQRLLPALLVGCDPLSDYFAALKSTAPRQMVAPEEKMF